MTISGCIGLVFAVSQIAMAADTVRMEKDVSYLSPGRQEKGDIHFPKAGARDERFPAVLNIHGGGWFSGDKERISREFSGCFRQPDC